MSILLNNISTIRKAKGIKQYQLASMLGIERTALSGIENGRYDASPKTMKTISDIFQKPIGEIFLTRMYSDTAQTYERMEIQMSENALEIRISEDNHLPSEVLEIIRNKLQFYSGVLEVLSHEQRHTAKIENNSLYLILNNKDGSVSFLIVVDWLVYHGAAPGIGCIDLNKFHFTDLDRFNRFLSLKEGA